MAARDYSQFPSRKQTAADKGHIKEHKEQGTENFEKMSFRTADWGLKGVKPSNESWGSDTASVDTYVTCEGLSHREGKEDKAFEIADKEAEGSEKY